MQGLCVSLPYAVIENVFGSVIYLFHAFHVLAVRGQPGNHGFSTAIPR